MSVAEEQRSEASEGEPEKRNTGRIEEINVPRDREGQFHTRVFDRYSRYEPQVAQGLTEMFVAGVSTHNVLSRCSPP